MASFRLSTAMMSAALFLLFVASTGAVPMGAYLGCYRADSAELQSGVEQVVGLATVSADRDACSTACFDGGYSLTIISQDGKCRCGMQAPPLSTRLSDKCGPGGVAVFYTTAASKTCRIVELPFVESNWAAAYNPGNVAFSAGTMNLALTGTQGTRVASKGINFLYGSFQVKAAIPCAPGVISSFYLRSSDKYADINTGASDGDFCEADFEFISSSGNPCSLWLNTFKGGVTKGELQMSEAEYQAKAGLATTSTWATYTFNWQPDFMTWAVDGRPLKTFRQGEATRYWTTRHTTWESPNAPMHPSFTIWTDTRPKPFGGVLDPSAGPYTASFKDLRMVVCDRASSSATGPAWMA